MPEDIAAYLAAIGLSSVRALLVVTAVIAMAERLSRDRRLPWQWFYATAFSIFIVFAPYFAWRETRDGLEAQLGETNTKIGVLEKRITDIENARPYLQTDLEKIDGLPFKLSTTDERLIVEFAYRVENTSDVHHVSVVVPGSAQDPSIADLGIYPSSFTLGPHQYKMVRIVSYTDTRKLSEKGETPSKFAEGIRKRERAVTFGILFQFQDLQDEQHVYGIKENVRVRGDGIVVLDRSETIENGGEPIRSVTQDEGS